MRFDRHEVAGAFGDIGTDLPLLVALIATCGLDAASVCIVFGLGQIATGLRYGIPMPIQPLKAMATIMLASQLSAGTLAGGGLVIGAAMLVLAATGLLDVLARVVPKDVVRGIQVGLGLTLARVALERYVSADGVAGYALAGLAFMALIALRGQRRVPAPLVVIGLGFVYALLFSLDSSALWSSVALSLPTVVVPTHDELVAGAILLALPQIPLSLGNSVIATSQTTRDLFPARAVSVRTIGFTYGLMNLIGPWFGGFPACHGCGGLVGFHAFGARTGGAPVLYGLGYLVVGLFVAPGFTQAVQVFPLPILGVVLLVESVALVLLARDVMHDRASAWVVALIAAAVLGLPFGYVIGLVAGTALSHALRRG